MGVYRTYFSKDNTIIKGKATNTGVNPILRLVHGGQSRTFTRAIFSFDLEKIKQKIADRTISGDVKHTLNLTNTVAYDVTVLHDLKEFGQEHASSFDLVLFRVPEFWDEGTGYDYDFNQTMVDINGNIVNSPSNYFHRSGLQKWTEEGMYSSPSSIRYDVIKTIHFDLGNENIHVDITNFINDLIINGTDNFHGLGLAYKYEQEQMFSEKLYSVDFYGKDTHTFFEPFLETSWDDHIVDDRNKFYFDKTNKLYLYSNVNKNPVNLDSVPTNVKIFDNNETEIMDITNVKHEGKGVYSVSLDLDFKDFNIDSVNFYDVWHGLQLNGRALNNVEMEFTVNVNDFFNIGNEVYEPTEFTFNFSGLKSGEKITQGEIRKVIVTIKEYFHDDPLVIDGIFYKIYVKQGNSHIPVIQETEFNRAFNQNFFYLDTSWLISQDYFLDIIVHTNGTVQSKDKIPFTILDGKTDNNTDI